jgi:glyoxylase-like metal-dependent hydrolase (beta-lactamase superfamily II)
MTKQLPMPSPLPETIPIPKADPPAELDLVAVPTDYDFDRLSGILLTHAHWDHMSGIPDFPDLPVLVSRRDRAAFHSPEMFAMASLRNPAIGALRLAGWDSIAEGLRHHGRMMSDSST